MQNPHYRITVATIQLSLLFMLKTVFCFTEMSLDNDFFVDKIYTPEEKQKIFPAFNDCSKDRKCCRIN